MVGLLTARPHKVSRPWNFILSLPQAAPRPGARAVGVSGHSIAFAFGCIPASENVNGRPAEARDVGSAKCEWAGFGSSADRAESCPEQKSRSR